MVLQKYAWKYLILWIKSEIDELALSVMSDQKERG